MIVLNSRNVNDALIAGVELIKDQGVVQGSRNGPVWRIQEPVVTVYRKPHECVLFSPWRDANPFFHLIEFLWLLGGRDDLKCITPYVPRMKDFSDDGGKTQPGSYGKRWRNHEVSVGRDGEYNWGDQLNWAVKKLRADPNDRRVVIQMYDPFVDGEGGAADRGGKDVPCNLLIVPQVINQELHITVTCRSNDMVLGAYGANAVHFAMLQVYLAGRLSVGIGCYNQISLNFHCYQESNISLETWTDPYTTNEVAPLSLFDNFPLASSTENGWTDEKRERIIQEDLRIFFDHSASEAATKARWPFLRQVAVPMAMAHQHWRNTRGEDRYLGALEILQQVQASDWRRAAEEWIQRRHRKWQLAADDGVHT